MRLATLALVLAACSGGAGTPPVDCNAYCPPDWASFGENEFLDPPDYYDVGGIYDLGVLAPDEPPYFAVFGGSLGAPEYDPEDQFAVEVPYGETTISVRTTETIGGYRASILLDVTTDEGFVSAGPGFAPFVTVQTGGPILIAVRRASGNTNYQLTVQPH